MINNTKYSCRIRVEQAFLPEEPVSLKFAYFCVSLRARPPSYLNYRYRKPPTQVSPTPTIHVTFNFITAKIPEHFLYLLRQEY
jgi:hypothetical protein